MAAQQTRDQGVTLGWGKGGTAAVGGVSTAETGPRERGAEIPVSRPERGRDMMSYVRREVWILVIAMLAVGIVVVCQAST